MYALEYKQLYIPREALTKNRCFQGYRWNSTPYARNGSRWSRSKPRRKGRRSGVSSRWPIASDPPPPDTLEPPHR